MKNTTDGPTMRRGYWLLTWTMTRGSTISRETLKQTKSMDVYDAARELKGHLEDITYDEKCDTYKICNNWTQRDWHEINFNEIVKSWREE